MEHLWLAFPTGQVPFEGRYFMVVTCLFIPPPTPTPAWQSVFQKLAASCVSVFLTRLGSEAAQHVQLEACPLWFGRIKFFQSRPFSRQLPGDLCPKGICLEPNRSRMDYKPAQTPKDYMMCLWLWNHLRPGIKPHQGCQWAHWRKQNEDLGPTVEWMLRESLLAEPCLTLQKLNKRKSYAMLFVWTTLPFMKKTAEPVEYLLFFCLILGNKTMSYLAQKRKGDYTDGVESLPYPHWMRKYLKRL